MATKYVQDTKAGKSISAWVILRKNGEHVATVRSHYSDGGSVLVNVWNHGQDNPSCALDFQHGKAGGYGYDKLTAALRGMEIDGHKLTDHCGEQKKLKGGKLWPRDAKAPRGYQFANWTSWKWGGKEGQERIELPKSEQGYSSCYRISGLDYLKAFGYQVIKAI